MSPLLTTFASAGVRAYGFAAAGAAGTFELISTQVLGSTATSVTFSSIPSSYTHLQLRVVARNNSAAASSMGLQFNGVTTSTYNVHILYGNGSAVTSGNILSSAYAMYASYPGTDVASTYGPMIVDILDYANTNKNKTTRYMLGNVSGTNRALLGSGLYPSTTAISSLNLFDIAGNSFVAGSRFSLYGIKGA